MSTLEFESQLPHDLPVQLSRSLYRYSARSHSTSIARRNLADSQRRLPQVRDVRMFWGNSSGWNKIMVAMSDEMVKALEQERKGRKLESIPETVRAVLGEYFKAKS
jgi:hypothetical protein